jgi:hypothetical protein
MITNEQESIKKIMEYSVENAPAELKQMVMSRVEQEVDSVPRAVGYSWIIPLIAILVLSLVIAGFMILDGEQLKNKAIVKSIMNMVYSPLPWILISSLGLFLALDSVIPDLINYFFGNRIQGADKQSL